MRSGKVKFAFADLIRKLSLLSMLSVIAAAIACKAEDSSSGSRTPAKAVDGSATPLANANNSANSKNKTVTQNNCLGNANPGSGNSTGNCSNSNSGDYNTNGSNGNTNGGISNDSNNSGSNSTIGNGGDGSSSNQTATDATGSYQKTEVLIPGSRGDKIPANLFIPLKARKAKMPAVLLQYGIGGTKDSGYIVQIGERFASAGFVILTIDAPHIGKRADPGAKDKYDVILSSLNSNLFSWYLGDYGQAVSYLANRSEVDAANIGYAGMSWGAITGIPFCAIDKRVKAVVSIVGGGGFFGVVVPFQFDPAEKVKLIAPRAVLLINANQDEVILPIFSHALQNAAGANATKVWVDGNHELTTGDREKVGQMAEDFLKSHLGL